MSGPIAASYDVEPITVMLSAAFTRLRSGKEQAQALQAACAAQKNKQQYERLLSQQQQQAALQQKITLAESEIDAMLQLAASYGQTQQRPAPSGNLNNEIDALAYIESLKQATQNIRRILRTHNALQPIDKPSANLDALLATDEPKTNDDPLQRLLARIEHLAERPAPIQNLVREIKAEANLETQRAKLLLTELRLRIQQHLESAQAKEIEAASATVLQSSLEELGYQVEPITDTLFVEGGVLHFRRQGWGNYMVRMRINPQNKQANFNVIRAVSESNNERSVLDHLAEDRWCAEFPALLQTMAKNGLTLNVTRRLQAGEVPVQLVQQDKLPRFADEENTQTQANLRAREIK